MNNYFYSPATNGFYAEELRDIYESAGSWPADALAVSQEVYNEFQTEPSPDGKMRSSGPNGIPTWVDIPAPTKEQIIFEAKNKLTLLMTNATLAISPLQDAIDIGTATQDELTLLKDWKTYRVALNRLDLSTAPDISWPEIPA